MVAPLRSAADSSPPARRLGAGGEAEVFEVPGRPRLAFKKYKQPTPERTAKLRVMLAHRPTVDGGKASIAWPVELVPGPQGEAAGFLMPRIDLATSVPLFRVYNPQSRQQVAPGFTWRYLLRTARNVAAVVDAVHRAGYVIGDLNESNLLVSNRALVALVDCDSMQVRDPITGDVHHCRVGKPEFTAPELHKVNLSARDRTEASDAFALAVLVFHLLMEGVHPFAGIWRGRGDPPDIAARIRSSRFPYRWGRKLVPPPMGLDLMVLPPAVRRLVWRTFTSGMRRASRRPLAAEWLAALEGAEASLTRCRRSPHHEYADHLRRCPWCARIDAGMPDPFPGPTGKSPLSPTPPTRLQRAVRLTRDRVATWRRATTALAWRAVRTAPSRVWRVLRGAVGWRPTATGVRRVAAAGVLGVDVPALVLIAAVGALAPPAVLAGVGLLVIPTAHATIQAVSRRRGRARTLATTVRVMPANLLAGVRATAFAAVVAAGVVVAVGLGLVLVDGDHLGPRTVLDRADDHRHVAGALFAVLVTVRPRSRHPGWSPGLARARVWLHARVHGRLVIAAWTAAVVAATAAIALHR